MRLLAYAAAATCILGASIAHATPPKREPPSYDRRESPKTTASDVLLWPPRIVLFPLYLASEYLIRRPLGAVATHAEKHHWPTHLVDFFTFRERRAGVIPTAFYEFGYHPSVGAYAFWNDAFVPNNDLRFQGATWGPNWISAAVRDRVTFDNGRTTWSMRAEYTKRPDGLFAGIGPSTLESGVARFGFTKLATSTTLDFRFWRSSHFKATVGVRSLDFRDDQRCCGDPTLATAVARGDNTYPPGFFEGYTALHNSLELSFDNRIVNGDLSGYRLAFDAEHGGDMRAGARQWLRYSAQGGLFADLDGRGRVLGVTLGAYFSDPIRGEVPFTELVSFPTNATLPAGFVGTGPLRGFRPGRLVDRSGMVATLLYEWPIWVWLDGTLHVAAGNVYGPHLRELDPKLTRLSTGIGFRTVGTPDTQFEALVAVGTETIEDGLKLNTIRALIGATRGF